MSALVLAWLWACCPGPMPCDGAEPEAVGTVPLTEASGLVASARPGGALWSHDDGDGDVVLLDSDGSERTWLELDAEVTDLEDIALGPGPDGATWVYLADIGDNDADRDTLALLRFLEPELEGWVGVDTWTPTVETVSVVLPSPVDSEALVVDETGDGWLWSKSSETVLFHIPDLASAQDGASLQAEQRTTIDLGRCLDAEVSVTGADLSEEALVLVSEDWLFSWERESAETPAELLARAGCADTLQEAADTEAVALVDDGVLTLAEGDDAQLFHRDR